MQAPKGGQRTAIINQKEKLSHFGWVCGGQVDAWIGYYKAVPQGNRSGAECGFHRKWRSRCIKTDAILPSARARPDEEFPITFLFQTVKSA